MIAQPIKIKLMAIKWSKTCMLWCYMSAYKFAYEKDKFLFHIIVLSSTFLSTIFFDIFEIRLLLRNTHTHTHSLTKFRAWIPWNLFKALNLFYVHWVNATLHIWTIKNSCNEGKKRRRENSKIDFWWNWIFTALYSVVHKMHVISWWWDAFYWLGLKLLQFSSEK